MGLKPAYVSVSLRPSIHLSTLSNINISETSRLIEIKFHLEYHWGEGMAALDFGLEWIRTLVSLATDSSNRVIIGKI